MKRKNLPGKIFRLTIVVGLFLLLAGCGGNDVDETAPALTFDGLQSATTTSPDRTLSGTVEPGATIEITVGDTDVPVTPDQDGFWTHALTLDPGTSVVTVSASDAAGNQSLFALTLTYDAVSIEAYTTPISTTSLTVSGLIDPDLLISPTLTVTLPDGTELASPPQAVVNGDTWSATLTGLQSGDNVLKASVDVDVAGVTTPVEPTVTITVDAAAPVVSFDQPPFTRFVVPSQTLTGGSEVGAVSVTVSPLPVDGAPVVDATTGDWSASILGLSVGKNAVAATVTANGKSAIARNLLFVDQAPPLVDSVSPAEGQLNVANDTEVVVVFIAEMNKDTINLGSFTLDDGAVSAAVSYDEVTKTATLKPDAALATGSHTAQLATTITDSAGDPLKQALSWDFTVQ